MDFRLSLYLATRLLAGPPGSILYRHRAVEYRFQLVAQSLQVYESLIGVYRLWVPPYFSSSILHVWSSNFDISSDGL